MTTERSYTEDDLRLAISESFPPQSDGEQKKTQYSSFEMFFKEEGKGRDDHVTESSSSCEKAATSPSWQAGFNRFRSMTVSAGLTASLIEKECHDRNASAMLAGWNVTNLIQGMGILGIPYAVKEGGLAAAACIFIVALFCDYTGILLVDCLYEVSPRSQRKKRIRMNYPDIGEAVWPGIGGRIVNVVQCIELYAAAVLYLVLLTTMFSQITARYVDMSLNKWALVCAAAVLPSVFIQKLSLIAWMSMLAVFSLMSAIATTIAYCVVHSEQWTTDNIPAFNPTEFPVGLGIVTFSYCAHAVFPGIEGSMKKPEQFRPMMHISFFVAAVVKTMFGIFAVLTFGIATDQVVTVNLADDVVFNTVATVFVALNVFFSFPLPLFVVVEAFDNALLPYYPHLRAGTKYHWYWLLLTRVFMVTFALFIALVVPHFGLLMGFVGSFTGTFLSFCFPCIFHLKLRWRYLRWYHIVGESFLIVFGLVAGVFGLFYSGKALINAFNTF